MEFTEEEVREKLRELGYVDVPKDKLQEFMYDLQELIEHESINTTSISAYSTGTETEEESPGSKFYVRKPLDEHNSSRRSAFSKEKMSYSGKHNTADDEKENISIYDRTSDTLSSTLTYSEDESKMNDSRMPSEVRRKVARKRNGQIRVFDETFSETESQAADITAMEERLRNLPLSERDFPTMAVRQPGERYRPPSFISTRSRQSTDSETNASLPAFIRTSRLHPHTRGLRKCDPVAMYHKFKEEWKQNKIPGESKHSTLRWQVRGQMLNYEMFERPRRRHQAANDYVVPTDKKRQALRWEVRSSMAKMS